METEGKTDGADRLLVPKPQTRTFAVGSEVVIARASKYAAARGDGQMRPTCVQGGHHSTLNLQVEETRFVGRSGARFILLRYDDMLWVRTVVCVAEPECGVSFHWGG